MLQDSKGEPGKLTARSLVLLILRCAVGGLLMGLSTLVLGISGGTGVAEAAKPA